MSELPIVRPRLAFEREFGQHRNWWVRDHRIAGTPLSVYLYLLSHDPTRMPTQTEARHELGFGKDAWQAAKQRLLEAGFLVEVRDRYPDGYVDQRGRHRGRQRRFRLFLQDPEPGTSVREQDAVIELLEPYEDWIAALEEAETPKNGASEKTPISPSAENPHTEENPPTADNPHTAENPHTADNPQSFKEEKTGWDGMGLIKDPPHPSNSDPQGAETATEPGAADADVDRELASIDPRLSVASLSHEIRGRVDIAEVDLVRACREILGAHRQPGGVSYPPAYCAKSIIGAPGRWHAGSRPYQNTQARIRDQEPDWAGLAECARGEHDWGPEKWGELARGVCLRCEAVRRHVDPAFAALENDLDPIGGERNGAHH